MVGLICLCISGVVVEVVVVVVVVAVEEEEGDAFLDKDNDHEGGRRYFPKLDTHPLSSWLVSLRRVVSDASVALGCKKSGTVPSSSSLLFDGYK